MTVIRKNQIASAYIIAGYERNHKIIGSNDRFGLIKQF